MPPELDKEIGAGTQENEVDNSQDSCQMNTPFRESYTRRAAAVELGPKGGKASAKRLTTEQRTEKARKADQATSEESQPPGASWAVSAAPFTREVSVVHVLKFRGYS